MPNLSHPLTKTKVVLAKKAYFSVKITCKSSFGFFTHPPFLHFLLLCCNSHFYATINKIRLVHENEQIDLNCAINYGIQLNNKKYKNLRGVKSILESIKRFPRHNISSLISIGQLCSYIGFKSEMWTSSNKTCCSRITSNTKTLFGLSF